MSVCTQQMRNKKVGFQQGVTWGTAVEPTTADGVELESYDLAPGTIRRSDNSNDSGRGFAQAQYLHEYESQESAFVMKLFEGGNFEKFLYNAFGTCTVTGTSVYTKKYVWEKCVSGLFLTSAWDEGTNSKCVNSSVISEVSLSVDDGFKFNASLMGDQLSDQTGSFTNPLGVTSEYNGDGIFKLTGAKWYLNDASGADFSAGDEILVTDINPVYTRGYVARDPESGLAYTSEPRDVNASDIMLNVSCSEITTATSNLLAKYTGNTYLKSKLEITGSLISGSDYYKITLYWPKLALFDSPQYGFEGSTPVDLQFKAYEASSAPTGMNEVMPYIEVINLLSTDYSA